MVASRLCRRFRLGTPVLRLVSGFRWPLMAAVWVSFLFTAATVQAQDAASTLSTIPLDDMEAFRPAAENWWIAGGAYANRAERRHLEAHPGTGVLVCVPTEEARDNLFTDWEHGDLQLELEVMMPKGSNSGIYLQGRYEVQLFDSWAKRDPSFSDIGGIYQRWDEDRPEGQKGFHGVPPRINAARAPGLWQHLEIDFRAPRFDNQGRKVENARFLRVALNGVTVQENIELTGPTRAAAFDDEAAEGPLMIQGDHGPVALRNIRFKRFGAGESLVSEVSYRYYEGTFEGMPSLDTLSATRRGQSAGIRHDVVANPDAFAVAFDGTISVPATGRYEFALQLNWVDDDPHFEGRTVGGGWLRIGNEAVVRHEGAGRTAEGDVHLEAGDHKFSLAYFKNRPWSRPVALLRAAGPDTREAVLNLASSLPPQEPASPVFVDTEGQVVMHRSMIDHEGVRRTHAMSIGDPSGPHYSIDFETGSLLRVWRGPFLDATPMWDSRGYAQVALPRGSVVSMPVAPVVAALAGESVPWPAEAPLDFEGYDLDDDGRPTIRYRSGGGAVTDRVVPDSSGSALRRTISVSGEGGLWHRAAVGDRIERLPDGSFAIGDKTYYVEIDDVYDPILRTSDGRQELLVPLGERALEYAIIW